MGGGEQTGDGIIYMEAPVWRYRNFGGSTFKTVSRPPQVEQFGFTFYTSTYICPSCHELLLKSNVGKRVHIRTEKVARYELTSVFLCPKCNFLFAAANHDLRLSSGICWFLSEHEKVADVVVTVEKVASKILVPYPCYDSRANRVFHHSTQFPRANWEGC